MSYYVENKEASELHQILIDFYTYLKSKLNPSKEQTHTEESSLLNSNPSTVIEYIKSTIDILITMEVEKAVKYVNEKEEGELEQDLEKLTQNLEAEVRSHIRVNPKL